MKFLRLALVALLSACWVVRAQQWSITNLTACGLGCIVETFPSSGCSVTDTACQCHNPSLQNAIGNCLTANCTLHDSLIVSKVAQSTCKVPHEDRSTTVIVLMAIILALTTFFVAIRLISKIWIDKGLNVEDYMIASALLLTIPAVYFTIAMSLNGFGKHLFDLEDGDLPHILLQFYISGNIYIIDFCITKISILAMYLRIFPFRGFHIAAWSIVAFIATSTMVIFFLMIFSCSPVSYFWDRDIKGGICMDVNAVAYASSATSIIGDLAVIAIPVPVLAKLKLNFKKRVGVAFMFALGSFGCVVSMIRLKSLVAFGSTVDPTWDYVDAVIWTALELAAAMICACLPTTRKFLIRVVPRDIIGSLLTSSRSQSAKSGSKGPRFGYHSSSSGGWKKRSKESSFPSEFSALETGRDADLFEMSSTAERGGEEQNEDADFFEPSSPAEAEGAEQNQDADFFESSSPAEHEVEGRNSDTDTTRAQAGSIDTSSGEDMMLPLQRPQVEVTPASPPPTTPSMTVTITGGQSHANEERLGRRWRRTIP